MTKDLWRSKDMTMVNLFCVRDIAHDVVAAIADTSAVQFIDCNSKVTAFNREFADEVVHISNLEATLKTLRDAVIESGIQIPPQVTPVERTIVDIEHALERTEAEYQELHQHHQQLRASRAQLTELLEVCTRTSEFLSASETSAGDRQEMEQLQAPSDDHTDEESGLLAALRAERRDRDRSLGFLAGTVNRAQTDALVRVVFRATRGNCYVRTADITESLPDPLTGMDVDKDVFVIFLAGEQTRARAGKLAEAMGGTLYQVPAALHGRLDMAARTRQRLSELEQLEKASGARLGMVLRQFASQVDSWTAVFRREKLIYHTLNLFALQPQSSCLLGRAWVLSEALTAVDLAVHQAHSRTSGTAPPILERVPFQKFGHVEVDSIPRRFKSPPTHFPVNKVTSAFQSLVNSYGMANYKEINPGWFYLFMFPFLFAVMFGDMGHGTMNLIVAILLVVKEKKLAKTPGGLNDIVEILFEGRYLVLIMSIMSVLSGLMYNDTFALGFDIFGSQFAWQEDTQLETGSSRHYTALWKGKDSDASPVYAFGMDPYWHWGDNSMIFLNSYKMKMSVVLGVTQMIIGLFIKLANCLYFKDWLNLLCCWIPEFIFMISFFGYMVFCIIYKWLIYYPGGTSHYSPSLTSMFIEMFLAPSDLQVNPDHTLFINSVGEKAVDFQYQLQLILVILCVISIFWLLLPKPYIQIKALKKHEAEVAARKAGKSLLSDAVEGHEVDEDEDDEEHGIGDIVVHQAIHTIEYCLGCISHTASYLRLWALSLAHAQLAEVFFEQLILIALNMDVSDNNIVNGLIVSIVVLIVYVGWLAMSVAVLCLMEALSAFLHGLRLHWIEFQSKFFGAEGYEFTCLEFTAPMTMEEEAIRARRE